MPTTRRCRPTSAPPGGSRASTRGATTGTTRPPAGHRPSWRASASAWVRRGWRDASARPRLAGAARAGGGRGALRADARRPRRPLAAGRGGRRRRRDRRDHRPHRVVGPGTPDRGARRDADPGRGAARRPLRGRRQPLAGDAGRPAGPLRARGRAGRVPHPRARGAARPAAGPAAGRSRHAPAPRALRPDDDVAARRPAALGGRRTVRRDRGAAPGPGSRTRPAADRPAPASRAGRGERRLRDAARRGRRRGTHPASPRRRPVRPPSRAEPGSRPRGPGPALRGRARSPRGPAVPAAGPRAGLDRAAAPLARRGRSPCSHAARMPRRSRGSHRSICGSTAWPIPRSGSCRPSRRVPDAGRSCAGRWSGSGIGSVPGRLWRATSERPTAALPEHRSRLVDIGS